MIPEDFINEWRNQAPWISNAQIEQDLIISRALVEIYTVEDLRQKLAFRGGTALHKVHFDVARRYSEDLDFVQVNPEGIGPTIDQLRAVLDPWLGTPNREFKEGLVKLLYRFTTQEGQKGRLKVEINSREHFLGSKTMSVPFSVESRWFSGNALITSVSLPWLLGSKLRALYQRRKGRDLFDLVLALGKGGVTGDEIAQTFLAHLNDSQITISRAQIEENLLKKIEDPIFVADLEPLLAGSFDDFDFVQGLQLIMAEVIGKLPGDPWKGGSDDQKTPVRSRRR